MSLLGKIKKYLKFSGGIKCMECGYYSENGSEWIDGVQRFKKCPKCGSGKTKSGILVTEDN